MLDLIHYLPPFRPFVVVALSWLSACATHRSTQAAQLELIGAPQPTACDSAPPGDLHLRGLDAPVRVQVSGAELCAGLTIQRELPPGLYTLSWQGSAQPAALDVSEDSLLRGPTVVSLFAGQSTVLRVQLAPATSASSSDAAVRGELPACSRSS